MHMSARKQRKSGKFYPRPPVPEKNDLTFDRGLIISVAITYFSAWTSCYGEAIAPVETGCRPIIRVPLIKSKWRLCFNRFLQSHFARFATNDMQPPR